MREGRELPPKKVMALVSAYLEERFGLGPDAFEGYGMYLASKGRVYLGPKTAIDKPKVVTLGLLIARVGGTVKPSTNLLQLYGRRITRNLIGLDKDQAAAFARGEDVRLQEGQDPDCSEGYVLMSYSGTPMGCGFLKAGMVKNLLPKAKRLELKHL